MNRERTKCTNVVDRVLGRTLLTACGLALAAITAFPAVGGANVKLWLYPEGAGPREGGHVVSDGAFTLVVENVGKADESAQALTLVIALNDPALLTSGSVTLPGGEVVDLATATFEIGVPSMPCSGAQIPRHGVYPTSYLEVPLDDLAGGEIWQIPVNVSGEAHLEVHFDATAEGFKTTGHGETCYDVVNPSGHDVTLAFAEPAEPTCPQVAITKSASTTGVALSEEVEYQIQVANQGDCPLTEVVITDTVPTVENGDGEQVPAFSIVATSPAPSSQDETSLAWALGAPLAPGESAMVSFTAAFDQAAADGQKVVNTACVAAAESEAPECDQAQVAVGQTAAQDDQVTGAGFWCNRIRLALAGGPGATYTPEELTALLALVDEQSAVFSELVDATTPELAQPLLCTPRNIPMADKLIRQLLALWLNVVSERLDPDLTLGDLCAGDEPLPPDTDLNLTVAGVIAGAEEAIVAGADHATAVEWMQLVDFINNATVGEECGAEAVGVVTHTAVRHGHGHRRSPK